MLRPCMVIPTLASDGFQLEPCMVIPTLASDGFQLDNGHMMMPWSRYQLKMAFLGKVFVPGKKSIHVGSSLVAQWLGLAAFTAMAWVHYLVGELKSCKQK